MTAGYLISFEPRLPTEDGLNEFFSSLFDVKKLAVVGRKEKEVEKIVIVIGLTQNVEMLVTNNIGFKDSKCFSEPITPERADELIIENRTKLYIGAIPYGVDNVLIWNHFAKFGSIDYSYVIRKPTRNGQKGFGFVTFKSRASLLKALSAKNCINGKKLIVSEFSSRPTNKKKKCHQENGSEKEAPKEEKTSSSPRDDQDSGIYSKGQCKNYLTPFQKDGKIYGQPRTEYSPYYEESFQDTSQLSLYYPEEQCTEYRSWFSSPRVALEKTMQCHSTIKCPRRCLARRETLDSIEPIYEGYSTNSSKKGKEMSHISGQKSSIHYGSRFHAGYYQ